MTMMMMMMMMMMMIVMMIIILLVHVRFWQDGGTWPPNGELIYKPLERENQPHHGLQKWSLDFFNFSQIVN